MRPESEIREAIEDHEQRIIECESGKSRPLHELEVPVLKICSQTLRWVVGEATSIMDLIWSSTR